MPEPEGTAIDQHQPPGTLARLAQLAWQALPAVAGAISLLGFVALIGGAIQWVRFWAAGLPADQAVRAVPEQELVTIGAVSLVGFSIIGLLAALGLYLLDKRGNATLGTLRGLFALAVIELFVALALVDLPKTTNWLLAAGIVVTGLLAYTALADVPRILRHRKADEREAELAEEALREAAERFRSASDHYDDAFFRTQLPPFDPPRSGAGADRPPPERPWSVPPDVETGLLVALRQAAVQLHRADREWDSAVERWVAAAAGDERERREKATRELRTDRPPTEEELEDICRPEPDPHPEGLPLRERLRVRWRGRRRSWQRLWRVARSKRAGAGTAAFLLLGISLPVLIVGENEEETLFGVVALVVAALTAATFGVAHITAKFAWYGIAAFASLIVFGATLNVGRTVRDPQVQPVALIRKGDDRPVCGLYVTETDKRLYVARVQVDDDAAQYGAVAGAGRMFWVPVDAIDVVSVGPLQNIPEARRRAIELTGEIQDDRATEPTSSTDSDLASAADPDRNRGCTQTNLSDEALEALERARDRATRRAARTSRARRDP
jgi:hypothetical protein